MLKKIETELQDCYIVEPSVFGDDRGYFSPFFIQKDMEENGMYFDGVVQCNRSKSSKGVVRGLHFQKDPKCQTKLVEVINGAAIDVVVDIRKGSPTYGKHTAVLLKPYDSKDEKSGRQLYVPRGFAHGFISLEDNTIFQYLIDNDYAPSMEGGILWNDPDLGIDWNSMFKEYGIDKPLTSEKDGKHLTLRKSPDYFKYNE
ncbi:MAG: dTDP-4-dehydrorhamnose 3,5-epimerase [Bacilli bacterium]|nr:dTDP-4-dehydrorhamnose 3,5-epimerase [Bacilli bacterium]